MTKIQGWARVDALGILLNARESQSLNWEKIFAPLGLDPESLTDPLATLPLEQFFEGFELAARALGNDAALFDIYSSLAPGDLSVFDYLFLCAPSLRLSFQAWERLISVRMSALHYHFEVADGWGRLIWPSLADYGQPRQNMYARIAWAAGRVELALDARPAPILLDLVGDPPSGDSAFLQRYGNRIRFGQDADMLMIREDLLQHVPKRTDTSLYALVNKAALDEIVQLERSNAQTYEVAASISRLLASGSCTVGEVAQDLGISPRSLQRNLAAQQTSFRDLIEEVRKANALRYLSETELSLKEIAYLLGFAQVSTFSRSARGWFGKPPRELRKASGTVS
ncbi:helix-turn-helix transcriptional regulator [Roseibium aestuarii]|uniref:Helix-turn-helix domain-containing protein n=1 Tax=Roseibium aestuarii TaxID=2600299 RepID=A0ABW4JVI9_9HYPH|nr:AraC family transcriptional regulator [Roseibium aestuarii]